MQDKINIQAPAKINLFLRVLNKRNDGYYNIRSGITFLNLFDEINIKKNNSNTIHYSGSFAPFHNFFNDCIIKKTLKLLNLDKKINLEINIKKNIPTQAGLGSASTNAAALIQGLEKLNIINKKNHYQYYSILGADIPVFLYGKNSIVTGIGEKILHHEFPKYYFVLVKPEINFSTKKMYNKINLGTQYSFNHDDSYNSNTIKYEDQGNDFENIAIKECNEIGLLLKYLSDDNNCIFARMTGSGSCCFGVYKRKEYSLKAQTKIKERFPKLWSFAGENNTIKD